MRYVESKKIHEMNANHCILVIDDDPDVADSVKATLESTIANCQAVTAASCHQGLVEIQNRPVDLVLVDYRMRDHDGLEFLSRARKLEPGLPVILMTGFGTPDLVAKALNVFHCDGFLPKPIDPLALSELVAATLHRDAFQRDARLHGID